MYFCKVKKAIFILSFLMLFKPLVPLVEYVVNYEYISEVLCENKEKPLIGCDGKCYLMSQLAKSSEDEKPISDKKVTVKQFELLFFEAIKPIVFLKRQKIQTTILNVNYSNLYTFLNSSNIFHPPSFIS